MDPQRHNHSDYEDGDDDDRHGYADGHIQRYGSSGHPGNSHRNGRESARRAAANTPQERPQLAFLADGYEVLSDPESDSSNSDGRRISRHRGTGSISFFDAAHRPPTPFPAMFAEAGGSGGMTRGSGFPSLLFAAPPTPPLPRMQLVFDAPTDCVAPGSKLQLLWVVRNSGSGSWPADVFLQPMYATVGAAPATTTSTPLLLDPPPVNHHPAASLPPLFSGHLLCIAISVQAPEASTYGQTVAGVDSYHVLAWRLVSSCYGPFGLLEAHVHVCTDPATCGHLSAGSELEDVDGPLPIGPFPQDRFSMFLQNMADGPADLRRGAVDEAAMVGVDMVDTLEERLGEVLLR